MLVTVCVVAHNVVRFRSCCGVAVAAAGYRVMVGGDFLRRC